jgi:diguanylate cyclase (GGDEF)-like protein
MPTARPMEQPGDTHDDGALPDLTSGLMWMATAVVGLAVLALPGTDREHLGWVLGLAGFAFGWGAVSVVLGWRGHVMPIGRRAVVTAATMPIVALALWATGGADSFLQPVLLFTALFLAWFFPPALAWPLVALFVGAYASPLLYDAGAVAAGYPARAAGFAVAVAGMTIAMQFLKRRLVRAELVQRTYAELDPLTRVGNRRGFDLALARADARGDGYTLVLFDLDRFKPINDEHGHPVGDAVLCAVADAARRVVRQGDCLARIGGDEFALIAPGAAEQGALRLVRALGEAIATAPLPPQVGDVSITFAWAVAPRDALDGHALFARADERLLEKKRGGRGREAEAAPAVAYRT